MSPFNLLKLFTVLFIALLANFNCIAQTAIANDTVVLSFNEFYNRFLKFHPVAKRANLLPEIAKQELRSARGNFDPVLQGALRGKDTKGTTIYEYLEPEIKIPTLIGVDIKAGMEQSNGVLVNPEFSKFDAATGNAVQANYQLFYGGISVPVFRGLITDARRTQLNLAKLLVNLNQAEQIKELNKLFLNAAKDYWNWQQSYQTYLLMVNNLNVAENRLNFIKNRINSGEEKPIDSIEAIIEYQRRDAMLAAAELDYLNQTIALSNNLWDEYEQAVTLAPNVVPSSLGSELVVITTDSLAAMVNFSQQNHPEIVKLGLKVKQYNFERKLALENIKPQLNVEYYPFQTYTNGKADMVSGIFTNNYKYGISFYSSLLLRKERGKLGSANFKLKQSEFDLMQGKREIINNIYASYNQLNNLNKLLSIQIALVNNNQILRNAEEFRFENGESSLFLVNQRERALIESEVKLAEIRAKYAKAKYELAWATGKNLFN